MGRYVGLDIGGTKCIAASSDPEGRILKKTLRPTPHALQEGLDLLQQMVGEVTGGEKIAGIGAAIGGPLDWRTGIVSPLHQPEWRNVPLKDIMEKAWGSPFSVDVDTNIAAWGEYLLGGETTRHLLYITISTGVGAGYIVDGKIYRGMGGSHPEAGHQSITFRCSNPSGISCECGAPDCLEALVSGNGVRRIYRKAPEKLSEEEWEEVTFNVAQGLRNLATICLPEVIVLGGGVALGRGEKLITGVRMIINKNMHLVPCPETRLSRLGNDTALMGALIAAKQGLE
jgi:glucokinase